MAKIVEHIGDIVLGHGLLSAETILRELRRRIMADLTTGGVPDAFALEFGELADIFSRFMPLLEQNYYETQIAAWIAGANEAAKRLPPSALELIADFGGNDPPFKVTDLLYPDDGDRIVKLPIIDRAAERLAERKVVTRDQFNQLSETARANAFTVADVDSTETLNKIRSELSEIIQDGPTLPEFRARMGEVLDKSTPLSPARIETIYRTNVHTSLNDAHEEIASNPVVSEVFPYQEYLAIRDARARPEHLALEKLGLNGTNVYRRDDEAFWAMFLPPWDYNCRCGVNLLTVEDAAERGVKEAKEWLKTGYRPNSPSRINSIDFRPSPGWSRRRTPAFA